VKSSLICKFTLTIVLSSLGGTLCHAYSLAEANAIKNRNDWNGLLQYGQAWAKAEPNNTNAWGIISQAYIFGLKRPDLALDATKRGVTLTPQQSGAWNALGYIYEYVKRYPDAVDAYQHAVNINPRNGTFWNNLAAAYSEENNYAAALQTLEKQAQMAGPSQPAEAWYDLGNGLSTIAASTRVGASSGKSSDQVLREAINAYNQCLRLDPQYANAYNNRAVAEQALGDAQSALNDYQRAASLGNSFGRKNYQSLQDALAEAKREAATRSSSNNPGCTWCVAQNVAYEHWRTDYYQHNNFPPPH
jgi:tetratricopeptide (TPR) repeat protein